MLTKSLTAPLVFYRTYSRRLSNGLRESWLQMVDRCTNGLIELGKLTPSEADLIRYCQLNFTALTSGRWQWVGGTDWVSKPVNVSGSYNCSNLVIDSFSRMALCMDLLMQGCGVGTIIETDIIAKLPEITTRLELEIVGYPGLANKMGADSHDTTLISITPIQTIISVGDSRQGWVDAYEEVLKSAAHDCYYHDCNKLTIDLSHVRAAGAPIKGFGGVSNPVGLKHMFERMVEILNGAVGRQLNAVEVTLLMDEPAKAIVAGNVRRSANIRQFSADDELAATAKDNLWDGERIDPKRDALRMSNHTRVFHYKPTLEQCTEAIQKQYNSGEGAIQWAGEAVARANADLLNDKKKKQTFLGEYEISRDAAREYLEFLIDSYAEEPIDKQKELDHRMMRYGLNPCAEVILNDNFCNLSEVHLNQLDPTDLAAQETAFKAAALSACALLHHNFIDERMQYSREIDPIVGVSFTGLFDFFVNAFGVDWLHWWQAGRPSKWLRGLLNPSVKQSLMSIGENHKHFMRNTQWDYGLIFTTIEQYYLNLWREIVESAVAEYCDRHGIKKPNRCTLVQPAGTKSLLTGASPGWHPPKAARFLRRITFAKNDPVALAAIDCGYSVIPSQSDKDENGDLLNDPFDSRCTEWLVEVPIAANWADLEGVDEIDISQFSALAQFDFYMQVQQHYSRHTTSATIEFRQHEIEPLAKRVYEAIRDDEGYISAALLARFDDKQTYPRLPFEPIDKFTYERHMSELAARRKFESFDEALAYRDASALTESVLTGPIGCDSDKCLLPERPKSE